METGKEVRSGGQARLVLLTPDVSPPIRNPVAAAAVQEEVVVRQLPRLQHLLRLHSRLCVIFAPKNHVYVAFSAATHAYAPMMNKHQSALLWSPSRNPMSNVE